ncbi:thioesterase domain-containing protein [Solirhodobacter olei]|uniref:thioesterase domain-containing protein n=1 Tax=Solirhodobacter olei TaxID=2493082 RepID=UPI000FDA7CEB|nr:thioesterase domain-containing protein [Solirhodobacter olei]
MAAPEKEEPKALRWLAGKTNGATLIFMPDFGGNVIYASPLVKALSDVCNCYSMLLPPEFLSPSGAPSIEELGSQFASKIIGSQLSGPIHILGHSYAGIPAYETGRQLAQRGAAPDMVWLLDLSRRRRFNLREVSRHPFAHFKGLSKYILANRRRLFLRRQNPDILSAYGVMPFNLTEHPESYRDIIRRNYAALLKYRPRPSGSPITVLQAIEEIDAFYEDGLGWRELSLGPFRSIDVPGNHLSMLRQHENANYIADLIRTDLLVEATPNGQNIRRSGSEIRENVT